MIVTWRTFARLLDDRDRLDVVRFWDLASTAPTKKNRDPDWTAGGLVAFDRQDAEWYVVRVNRDRLTPPGVLDLIGRTMLVDNELLDRDVPVRIERPRAEGGKFTTLMFRQRFPGADLQFREPKGSKTARAQIVAVAAEAGHVHLVEGPWDMEALLDELDLFPDGAHDDQVDCLSGGFREIKVRATGSDLPSPDVETATEQWEFVI